MGQLMRLTVAESIPPKLTGPWTSCSFARFDSRIAQKTPYVTSPDCMAKGQVRLRQFIRFSLIFPFSLIFQASQEAFEAVHIRARAAVLSLYPHKLHPSFTQLKMFCWTINADTKDSLRLFSPSTNLEYVQIFKGWTSFSHSVSSRASQRQTFSLLSLIFLEDFRHMAPDHFSIVLQIQSEEKKNPNYSFLEENMI